MERKFAFRADRWLLIVKSELASEGCQVLCISAAELERAQEINRCRRFHDSEADVSSKQMV